MVRFRETPVTDDAATLLLNEYFESRELSFPEAQGKYRPVFPAASAFEPPRGVFLVVEADTDDGVADVGCGGIRRLDTPDGAPVRFEVKHLWLQPRVRGRGYGRVLLGELERRAIDFGAGELVLDTNDSLLAAGGLYRSSGYVQVEPYNDNPNATTWYAKRVK
ncbi:GNAT family N-acetyltransferase [Parafrigoribacterium soli]|uniref:GNAT family N-acetyltransferase n=1 Tax=Parafrigoribacterium soli TaxID=3144663 RepID=UPI0032EE36FF